MTDPTPRTLAEEIGYALRVLDDAPEFLRGLDDPPGSIMQQRMAEAALRLRAALLPPAPDAGLLREAADRLERRALALDPGLPSEARRKLYDHLREDAARLRAAASRPGACAHQWTTVTDDPATWPPETLEDSPILVESESDGFEATVLRGWMLRRRLAMSPPYIGRWMPWPASPAKEGA